MDKAPLTIIYDQMGFEVNVPLTPRIISLVPSQTELLVDLGLSHNIVGITKFCIHPKELSKSKTIVGGTKKFRFDVIRKLQPNLIIGNKEENYQDGITALQQDFPVWMSDINTYDQALDMIRQVGRLTHTYDRALEIVNEIESGFERLEVIRPPKRVLYFIWQNPYMVVGANTFIDDILSKLGMDNVARHLSRYPSLEREEIQKLEPEVILLSSEPYPFKQNHIEHFQHLCPQAQVSVVDGEMFSWYGSRLRYAPEYFQTLQF